MVRPGRPGAGDAEAGVATVGGELTAVTVTLAVPLIPPLDAVTVNGPPAELPAVKNPPVLMLPPPLTVQLNDGCVARGTPD